MAEERKLLLLNQRLASESLRLIVQTQESPPQVHLSDQSEWRVHEAGGGGGSEEGFLARQFSVDVESRGTQLDYSGVRGHFRGEDLKLGSVFLSVFPVLIKPVQLGTVCVKVTLRCSKGNLETLRGAEDATGDMSDLGMYAAGLCPQLTLTEFEAVENSDIGQMLANYDEQTVVNEVKRFYKFGIIFQRKGQVEESELFGNQGHSESFERFLNFLGDKVSLLGHMGYAGGLDIATNHSGTESVYTKYQDVEIMFHVSTLLPYSAMDSQQTARKKRIGNDVVSIIFQDGPTPFTPEIITSQFLHVYIVIQPVVKNSQEEYMISIVTKHDVPDFAPDLLPSPSQPPGPELREQLLASLVDGEQAAAKVGKFALLQQRNREHHLASLVKELQSRGEKEVKKKWTERCCLI